MSTDKKKQPITPQEDEAADIKAAMKASLTTGSASNKQDIKLEEKNQTPAQFQKPLISLEELTAYLVDSLNQIFNRSSSSDSLLKSLDSLSLKALPQAVENTLQRLFGKIHPVFLRFAINPPSKEEMVSLLKEIAQAQEKLNFLEDLTNEVTEQIKESCLIKINGFRKLSQEWMNMLKIADPKLMEEFELQRAFELSKQNSKSSLQATDSPSSSSSSYSVSSRSSSSPSSISSSSSSSSSLDKKEGKLRDLEQKYTKELNFSNFQISVSWQDLLGQLASIDPDMQIVSEADKDIAQLSNSVGTAYLKIYQSNYLTLTNSVNLFCEEFDNAQNKLDALEKNANNLSSLSIKRELLSSIKNCREKIGICKAMIMGDFRYKAIAEEFYVQKGIKLSQLSMPLPQNVTAVSLDEKEEDEEEEDEEEEDEEDADKLEEALQLSEDLANPNSLEKYDDEEENGFEKEDHKDTDKIAKTLKSSESQAKPNSIIEQNQPPKSPSSPTRNVNNFFSQPPSTPGDASTFDARTGTESLDIKLTDKEESDEEGIDPEDAANLQTAMNMSMGGSLNEK